MISVEVIKENSKYKKIKIFGHAMYDDYGKDIVCSAKESLSYLVGKKGMTIDIRNNDINTQLLINNMVNLLKDLENNYPDNIKVK